MRSVKFAVVATALVFMAGCSQSIDQDTICKTDGTESPDSCKVGQKIVFMPKTWGNEQMPVGFVAMYCDHRYSIFATKGGVSCIYKPVDLD
jgi:hypothetical protein